MLINCKICRNQVASSAKTCPYCGVEKPGKSVLRSVFGVILLLIIISSIISQKKQGQDVSTTVKTPPTSALISPSVQEYTVWTSDWGNGIKATASNSPCPVKLLEDEGYQYVIQADIPIARLKKDDDAWNIVGDRAQTLQGCWSKRSDGFVNAKMFRKKDGKVFDEILNFDDGTWKMSY